MAWYHVNGCDCPVGCCDCGSSTTTATAQAQAMRIQSEALSKNQNLVSYEIAKKWDGKLPVYMMGNSVPLIDFKSLGK